MATDTEARAVLNDNEPRFRITGDPRPGQEFQLTCKPTNAASSTFIAVHDGEIRVTRYASQVISFPDETPVIAHWHGQYRTDGFAMTVADLKGHVAQWEREHPPVPLGRPRDPEPLPRQPAAKPGKATPPERQGLLGSLWTPSLGSGSDALARSVTGLTARGVRYSALLNGMSFSGFSAWDAWDDWASTTRAVRGA